MQETSNKSIFSVYLGEDLVQGAVEGLRWSELWMVVLAKVDEPRSQPSLHRPAFEHSSFPREIGSQSFQPVELSHLLGRLRPEEEGVQNLHISTMPVSKSTLMVG